jgi:hypothetical protein
MNDTPQTGDRIETVLAALRHAEPAPGMEQRITAALLRQAQQDATKPSRWTWLRVPQLAGVAAVLVAGLLLTTRFHHPHRGQASGFALPSDQARPVGADEAAQASLVQPAAAAKTPAHAPAVEGSKQLALLHNVQTRDVSRPTEQAQTEQGFPAPPLPLTEQERLLIRLVHRDDPVQLAQLTPAAREADLQRDREQVREFFKPAPMLAANFELEPYPTPGGTQ